ncbi:Guanine nucleotide exchange factor VAV3, partial [Fragariocoptes setiger]
GYRCKVCLLPAHKQCLAQTRACGTPALPPRLQPVSPSVGSTCSEDNASFFSTLGSSNTSNNPSGRFNTSLSLMGSDAHQRNTPKQPASTVEYNNIENHTASRLRQPLIPMNRASSTRVCQSPPLGTPTTKSFVQSSINVNQQNSVNHLMQQRRLLNGGSKSTPTISSVPLIRVMAISSFNGDSRYNELSMAVGDVIVVFNCNAEHPRKSHSKPTLHINGNKSTDSLKDVQKTVDHRDPSHNTWWVGKNLRTSNEGLFPADCVRTRSPERKVASCEEAQHSIDFDVAVDPAQHSYGNVDINFNKLDDGRDQQYANFVLNDYPWFSGRMDRDEAQSLLEKMTHGTFLVRISPKQNGNYVISLNYNGQVKHMRIHVSNDNQLFLSQTRYFKSIVELVTWYQENSLVESFHLLDAKLLVPYRNTD